MGEKLKCIFSGFGQFINKIAGTMLMDKIMTLVAKRDEVLPIVKIPAHRLGANMVQVDGFVDEAPSALVAEPTIKFVYARHGRFRSNSTEKSIGVRVMKKMPLSKDIPINTPREGTKGCQRKEA